MKTENQSPFYLFLKYNQMPHTDQTTEIVPYVELPSYFSTMKKPLKHLTVYLIPSMSSYCYKAMVL